MFQISDQDWQDITDNNILITQLPTFIGTAPSDDLCAEMEAIKYAIYLNPDRASMFFAKRVLIVEGPTEVALINKLIDDGRIKPKISGTVVVDSIGKFNIHRFMNLLEKLGIEHAVLRDEDNPANQQQQEVNNLIESSKNPLTTSVESVTPDLEGYLGLPSVGSRRDRKPQSAIYNYVNGNIDMNNLSAFCTTVEGLLS